MPTLNDSLSRTTYFERCAEKQSGVESLFKVALIKPIFLHLTGYTTYSRWLCLSLLISPHFNGSESIIVSAASQAKESKEQTCEVRTF